MLWQPSYTTQRNPLRGSTMPADAALFGTDKRHEASRGRWRS